MPNVYKYPTKPYNVIYKGVIICYYTGVLTRCYAGVVAQGLSQELLHGSCYTGVNFQVINLYPNSYKTPASQVFLNFSLLAAEAARPRPSKLIRNVTLCGDRASPTRICMVCAGANLCGDRVYRKHRREVKCEFSLPRLCVETSLCKSFCG